MLIKKLLVGIVLPILLAILAACTPSTDPVVVTRVVEEGVTREVSPPETDDNVPIEVTRVVPEPTATEIAPARSPVQENVIFDGYATEDIPSLDPQIAEDYLSLDYIENLYVSLTNYELDTAEVVPEAAVSWEASEDGLLYIFHLRTDIPWVYHNPVTGETVQVTDEAGNPRFVTADDFVYGIRRACDPNIGGYYSNIIAPVIVGCEAVLNAANPNAVSEEAVAAIGVTAVDEATLVVELNFPASYFLSMTPLWAMAATPEWAITEFGGNWTEAGAIITNGPYVLHEWIHSVRISLVRNPMMPEDMQGTGNIEKHVVTIVPDAETGYNLWLNNDVDYSSIPVEAVQTHLDAFPDETIQVSDQAVFYISFRMTKAPFDDPHVRRAFSAAFDREAFIEEVRQGQGLPMKHFAPPGIFGAPPIDEIGVGFDPEFARAELEAAGYPSCEGFPQITLLAYSGQSTLGWIEFAQAQWEKHLGCDPDVFYFEQQAFSELLLATANDTDDAEAPHIWTLGWGPDYADENNWVGDVLACDGSYNRSKRPCTEIDDLLLEARQEFDPARRIELYAEIEAAFFGPEGEFPIMPIWVRATYVGIHSWYDYTPALFAGDQWYNYNIDMEAKEAGQE